MILTLPVADVLREFYPNAEIEMLVQSRVYELIQDYPALDKVIKVDRVSVRTIKQICKQRNYDLAIVVYPEFALAFGLMLGGVKYRLGTGYRWFSFLFNFRHYMHRKEALKHESRYNLDLLKELNISYDKELEPNLNVLDDCFIKAKNKVIDSNHGKFLNETDKYIVIHIPSLGSAKVWSDENFRNLLNFLISKESSEFKIIFTGTAEEKPQILYVIHKNIENSRIFTALNLNLKELAAMISRAELFLGNSTGPIHLAAAVGTFVIGLYSPVKVESPLRWGPLTSNKKIFVPVEDDVSRDVMNDIKPEEVFEFIINYMEGSLK